MSSALLQLQTEIATQLAADVFFADVPVLTEKIKDIATVLQISLGPYQETGGKCGVCAVVTTPIASVGQQNIPGPFFDRIGIFIRVIENEIVNHDATVGIAKNALEIAEKACSILHQWTPASSSCPILCDTPTIVLVPNESYIIYDVKFSLKSGLTYSLSQVATPVITWSSPNMTIACATGGAAIFYSTNGNYPSPRGGTLYTGSFVPGTGKTVRVKAWLAGYLTSEEATQAT